MDNQKLKTLVVLNRKCTVSANSLNEMFGLCRHVEPSSKLKDDIEFNKGLVEAFGKVNDIIPNVERIENSTGFGGVVHSELTPAVNEDNTDVVHAIKQDNVVVKQETPPENVKRDYVEVSGFEIV